MVMIYKQLSSIFTNNIVSFEYKISDIIKIMLFFANFRKTVNLIAKSRNNRSA